MTTTTTNYKLTPSAIARYDDVRHEWHVDVTWSCDRPDLLDRTRGGGWILGPNHKRLAERLAAAVNAGVVHGVAELRTDINGKGYASASVKVHGRTANADLKRLGF